MEEHGSGDDILATPIRREPFTESAMDGIEDGIFDLDNIFGALPNAEIGGPSAAFGLHAAPGRSMDDDVESGSGLFFTPQKQPEFVSPAATPASQLAKSWKQSSSKVVQQAPVADPNTRVKAVLAPSKYVPGSTVWDLERQMDSIVPHKKDPEALAPASVLDFILDALGKRRLMVSGKKNSFAIFDTSYQNLKRGAKFSKFTRLIATIAHDIQPPEVPAEPQPAPVTPPKHVQGIRSAAVLRKSVRPGRKVNKEEEAIESAAKSLDAAILGDGQAPKAKISFNERYSLRSAAPPAAELSDEGVESSSSCDPGLPPPGLLKTRSARKKITHGELSSSSPGESEQPHADLNLSNAEIQLLEDLRVSDSSASESGDSDDTDLSDEDVDSGAGKSGGSRSVDVDEVDGVQRSSASSVRTTDSGFHEGRALSDDRENLRTVDDDALAAVSISAPHPRHGKETESPSSETRRTSSLVPCTSRQSVTAGSARRTPEGLHLASTNSDIDLLNCVVQTASLQRKGRNKSVSSSKIATGNQGAQKKSSVESRGKASVARGISSDLVPALGGIKPSLGMGKKSYGRKCPDCPFKSFNPPQFAKHIEGHCRNAAFKCASCSFSADVPYWVDRHAKVHRRNEDQSANRNEPSVILEAEVSDLPAPSGRQGSPCGPVPDVLSTEFGVSPPVMKSAELDTGAGLAAVTPSGLRNYIIPRTEMDTESDSNSDELLTTPLRRSTRGQQKTSSETEPSCSLVERQDSTEPEYRPRLTRNSRRVQAETEWIKLEGGPTSIPSAKRSRSDVTRPSLSRRKFVGASRQTSLSRSRGRRLSDSPEIRIRSAPTERHRTTPGSSLRETITVDGKSSEGPAHSSGLAATTASLPSEPVETRRPASATDQSLRGAGGPAISQPQGAMTNKFISAALNLRTPSSSPQMNLPTVTSSSSRESTVVPLVSANVRPRRAAGDKAGANISQMSAAGNSKKRVLPGPTNRKHASSSVERTDRFPPLRGRSRTRNPSPLSDDGLNPVEESVDVVHLQCASHVSAPEVSESELLPDRSEKPYSELEDTLMLLESNLADCSQEIYPPAGPFGTPPQQSAEEVISVALLESVADCSQEIYPPPGLCRTPPEQPAKDVVPVVLHTSPYELRSVSPAKPSSASVVPAPLEVPPVKPATAKARLSLSPVSSASAASMILIKDEIRSPKKSRLASSPLARPATVQKGGGHKRSQDVITIDDDDEDSCEIVKIVPRRPGTSSATPSQFPKPRRKTKTETFNNGTPAAPATKSVVPPPSSRSSSPEFLPMNPIQSSNVVRRTETKRARESSSHSFSPVKIPRRR